jgi:hypothetical protein
MALSLSFSEFTAPFARTKIGELPLEAQQVTISDIYVKVDSLTGNKNFLMATVSFTKEIKFAERTYTFNVDLEGPNFIQQAYLHLKTLPEFADAIDC